MTEEMKIAYRWVNGVDCTQAEWDKVDALLATRGWMSLNRNTTRILLAESADGIVHGFNVFQMIPYVGPLYVLPSARGTGVAAELSGRMFDFLREAEARGFIAIAQSPHAARLCEAFGMRKIEHPVYVLGGA